MTFFKPITSSYASVMRYETDLEKLPTLHRYVWKGKFEKILKFLSDEEHQWKVNKKDDYQRTPLHLASSKGDVKIVQFLLSIDLKSINCLDNDGCTPFCKAAQTLSLDCMKALVAYGARITCVDFKKNSIMDKIIIEFGDGATQCLQYLLTNQNQEATLRDGVTLLHIAVKYGRIGVVKMLVGLGIDVNATVANGLGKTPLIKAVENEYFAITEFLLKNHANIYVKDQNGKTVKNFAKKESRFLKLIEQYDNTNYMLDAPTTNKVFVKFHKSSSVDVKQEAISDDEMRTGRMMRKIVEIESEIKRYEENIKLEQTKSEEVLKQSQAIKKQRNEAMMKQNRKLNLEEFRRPKVMFKKIFKAGYYTQEEWVEHFDALVERYDKLQRGYEKLLLAETEKELEIEECIEILQNATQKKLKLEEVKNEIEKTLDEKKNLNDEIEELKMTITKEKSNFKNLIQTSNMIKGKLTKTLEMMKIKKRRKMEELQVYIDGEEEIVNEIETCDQMLNGQHQMKIKLVNKIKFLKNKCAKGKEECAKSARQKSDIE